MAVYDNGASFRVGKLYVSSTEQVDNLNAEKLCGKGPGDFIQTGDNFGISQSGKALSMSGETVALDATSKIKIGNIFIQSCENGNGILIGIEE